MSTRIPVVPKIPELIFLDESTKYVLIVKVVVKTGELLNVCVFIKLFRKSIYIHFFCT